MAEVAYNAKNASTGHTPFELNCGYHASVSFEEDVDPRSRFRSANELAEELRELMEVCCQNLLYAQELQKRAHDKGVKSRSYAPGEKVWLNSKYIKTRRNKKFEITDQRLLCASGGSTGGKTLAQIPHWWSHGSGE